MTDTPQNMRDGRLRTRKGSMRGKGDQTRLGTAGSRGDLLAVFVQSV